MLSSKCERRKICISPQALFMRHYFPSEIEPKWQEIWEKDGLYKFKEDAKSENTTT